MGDCQIFKPGASVVEIFHNSPGSENIPGFVAVGIGPVLKNRLLDHFQTIGAIKQASRETLMEIKGVSRSLADRIVAYLNDTREGSSP